jgi:hypothetical protein
MAAEVPGYFHSVSMGGRADFQSPHHGGLMIPPRFAGGVFIIVRIFIAKLYAKRPQNWGCNQKIHSKIVKYWEA